MSSMFYIAKAPFVCVPVSLRMCPMLPVPNGSAFGNSRQMKWGCLFRHIHRRPFGSQHLISCMGPGLQRNKSPVRHHVELKLAQCLHFPVRVNRAQTAGTNQPRHNLCCSCSLYEPISPYYTHETAQAGRTSVHMTLD